MKTNRAWMTRLGIVFFSIGILLGVLLFALLNWARLEAYFYFGYSGQAQKSLTTLKCPPIMMTSEQGTVTATIANTSDRALEREVRTDISNLGVTRTVIADLSFARGETKKLQWVVTSDDVVFGHLILVEVYVTRDYVLPDLQGTCGSLVFDQPGLTGNEIFASALATWLLGTILGWALWIAGNRPMKGRSLDATRSMVMLTIVVLAGMVSAFLGWWPVGVLCLVLAVLLIAATTGFFVQSL